MENHGAPSQEVLSNAEIADRLAGLAQLLSSQKENPYKVRAYRRAAAKIRTLPESLEQLVREDADLTRYAGIGNAIASAIREIVLTGALSKLEKLKADSDPRLVELNQHPRLDPARVFRVYKKLGISSIAELGQKLEAGEIESVLGFRLAEHIRQGLTETHAMLLYKADDLCDAVREFLLGACGVRRAELAGACRRRVEVVEEITFVVETGDFPAVVPRLQGYGGRTPLLESADDFAVLALSSGVLLRVQLAEPLRWGLQMIACTGSRAHLAKLRKTTGPLRNTPVPSEESFYRRFGMAYIEPELREGHDEIERALNGNPPRLVTPADIRGDLHAHTVYSDGSDSIQDMAEAAQALGYEYLGITDHSRSLKIARGVPAEALLEQIRSIDDLNGRLTGFRILKSSEVDILADGSLDYPDEILRELDYTVCSIHSNFRLNREQQTERLLRAMDNRHFRILGHATGRILLGRPGYEIDIDRVVAHAGRNGCSFEINSSPNRLDLSAENARLAAAAGVPIAVNTDSHSTGEFRLIRCGIDQARRAGLEPAAILNCQPLEKLLAFFRR
jgi:DNA polymerase (family 10)